MRQRLEFILTMASGRKEHIPPADGLGGDAPWCTPALPPRDASRVRLRFAITLRSQVRHLFRRGSRDMDRERCAATIPAPGPRNQHSPLITRQPTPEEARPCARQASTSSSSCCQAPRARSSFERRGARISHYYGSTLLVASFHRLSLNFTTRDDVRDLRQSPHRDTSHDPALHKTRETDPVGRPRAHLSPLRVSRLGDCTRALVLQ